MAEPSGPAPGQQQPTSGQPARAAWGPWRLVVGFGVISLAADMTYEGARSLYGPLLSALGASALVAGLVSGAGEAAALLLRLVSGPLADRTHRYWTLTIVGYVLTAVCVPLLAITPALGGAGLTVAAGLILAERLGKAVRSPAKSVLLADAAGQVGMGAGMGVHKALDQIGAFAGPLLVAALIAVTGGLLWPALAALVVPGAVSIVLLVVVRARVPAPVDGAPAAPQLSEAAPRMPGRFWLFGAASAVCTAGLVTFGLIGFHLAEAGVVPSAGVPLLYALAMAAAAASALVSGAMYDRRGPIVLLGLPVLIAVVPALAFHTQLIAVIAGVVAWGAAVGVQDSTVKAFVADLVPRPRRATAYGLFAALQGGGALLGGAGAGLLLQNSVGTLVAGVAVSQLIAFVMLAALQRAAASTLGG